MLLDLLKRPDTTEDGLLNEHHRQSQATATPCSYSGVMLDAVPFCNSDRSGYYERDDGPLMSVRNIAQAWDGLGRACGLETQLSLFKVGYIYIPIEYSRNNISTTYLLPGTILVESATYVDWLLIYTQICTYVCRILSGDSAFHEVVH